MFMVINNNLTYSALVNQRLILASLVVEVKNSTVPTGERFYDIPAENINVVNLPAKNWLILQKMQCYQQLLVTWLSTIIK